MQLEIFIPIVPPTPQSTSRATHCMYAYRIVPDPTAPSRKLVGQNDGGERGSGNRLSRLLKIIERENVVVVVSRWYGSIKLGSERWRLVLGSDVPA